MHSPRDTNTGRDASQRGAVEREILRPLWKIHILYHAAERPIIGNWMLEELRQHGYGVSPGTLYPLLRRLQRLGWLDGVERDQPGRGGRRAIEYTLTPAGQDALNEVRARLLELGKEVFGDGEG